METLSQELQTFSEVKATYSPKVRPSERPRIASSYDAYNILKFMYADNMEYCESFVIMLLNRANKVIGCNVVSIGGLSQILVDVKKIFQVALVANASSIILSHNHPSGNTQPSEEDIRLTEKIKQGAKLLDLNIIDHIILCAENKYYSFADEGKL